MTTAYETDFAKWAAEQADFLKAGRLQHLDIENLVEEIQAMSRKEHRELMNRLIVLIAHLLKWQFQPSHRGASWTNTVEEQRREISGLLEDSPSLKNHFDDGVWLQTVWQRAQRQAVRETGLNTLPGQPIWTMEEILDEDFYPENPSLD